MGRERALESNKRFFWCRSKKRKRENTSSVAVDAVVKF